MVVQVAGRWRPSRPGLGLVTTIAPSESEPDSDPEPESLRVGHWQGATAEPQPAAGTQAGRAVPR